MCSCALWARWQRAPRRWHWNGLEQQPRLVVRLKGEGGPCALVDVKLGDQVDLDAADLARPLSHELANAPAKVLQAQKDWLADEGATSVRRRS